VQEMEEPGRLVWWTSAVVVQAGAANHVTAPERSAIGKITRSGLVELAGRGRVKMGDDPVVARDAGSLRVRRRASRCYRAPRSWRPSTSWSRSSRGLCEVTRPSALPASWSPVVGWAAHASSRYTAAGAAAEQPRTIE